MDKRIAPQKVRFVETLVKSKQIGFYSVDKNMKFRPDDSELKFLKLPSDMGNVNFDLNTAYAEAVKWITDDDGNMDNLLRWILLNSQKLMTERPKRMLDVDFVCYRGLLRRVMCSPCEVFNGWIVCATKFAGNIYLFQFPTAQEKEYELNISDEHKLMISWGKKFEQYMTSDTPASLPEDPSLPMNELRGFHSVYRVTVKGFSLLVSAEVDALKPEFSSQKGASSAAGYVELKTSRNVDDGRREKNLQRKMNVWWAQSFIVGIPAIICGFRNDNGIVQSIKEYSTDELPRIAQKYWYPKECLNFLLDFLDLVNRYLVKDNPRVIYKFEWHPGQQLQCEELKEAEAYQFIPDWYICDVEALLTRPA